MSSIVKGVLSGQFRWLLMLAAALMVVALVACGSEEPTERSSSSERTASGEDSGSDSDEEEREDADRSESRPSILRRQGPTTAPTRAAPTSAQPAARSQASGTVPAPTAAAPGRPAATESTSATSAPEPTATSQDGPSRPTSTPTIAEAISADWILENDNPLFLAAMSGSAAEVEQLLDEFGIQSRGTTITNSLRESMSYRGVSALHLAAAFNPDPEVITVILTETGDTESRTEGGGGPSFTPLLFAAIFNEEPRVAEVLLEWGADITALIYRDRGRGYVDSALQLAALYNSNPEVAGVLIDWGAEYNIEEIGVHPAVLAARNPNLEMIQFLLERTAEGQNKQAILDVALNHGSLFITNTQIIKLLLDLGADVNAEISESTALDRSALTALQAAACCNPNPDILALLLSNGADISKRGSDGRTVMHSVIGNSNPAVAALLLEFGADIDSKDLAGRTALFEATSPEMVDFLLANGADVHAKDNRGLTPLLSQFFHHSNTSFSPSKYVFEVVPTLVAGGADVDSRTEDGRPLLIWAAERGYSWTVELFVANGADTTVLDSEGNGLLHLAVLSGHEGLVEFLLDGGADRKSENNSGKTPCQIARDNGRLTGPLLGQLCRP